MAPNQAAEADLRYPIGKWQRQDNLTPGQRRQFIDAIAETPERLRKAVHGLSPERLDTPYRPGGWTVRQVVHHVADSHMNAYIRFKLGVTENNPQSRRTTKACGPNSRTRRPRPSNRLWRCSKICTIAGSFFCARSAPPIGRAKSAIRNGARSRSTGSSRTMPGTARTTSHTSRRCAKETDGNEREAKMLRSKIDARQVESRCQLVLCPLNN